MSSPIRRIGALALALTLAACSADQATAPTPMKAPAGDPSASLLGGLLGTVTGALQLTTAEGIQRTEPLEAPITVVKTIGYEGGTLSIPEAGVKVTVPRGALSRNTEITMTARAGSLVAYDFSPHGITFNKPLVFEQSLRGTKVGLLQVPFLRLAYYDNPSLLGEVTGVVSELLGGVTNLLGWTFVAPIKHFSGYMLSCGRGDFR
jgi:ZU5 domain-containing protein